MSEEIADVIDATADLIERDGWCQRTNRNDDGQYCIRGALMRTIALRMPILVETPRAEQARVIIHRQQADKLAVQAILSCAVLSGYRRFSSVERFNDVDSRTKQQVLDVLRLSAKKERGVVPELV